MSRTDPALAHWPTKSKQQQVLSLFFDAACQTKNTPNNCALRFFLDGLRFLLKHLLNGLRQFGGIRFGHAAEVLHQLAVFTYQVFIEVPFRLLGLTGQGFE